MWLVEILSIGAMLALMGTSMLAQPPGRPE